MADTSQLRRVVVVGGGTAGITVAAQLRRARKQLEVIVIEPSANHYYQPAWTLVGGGTYDLEKTRRDERAVIPPGVRWVQDAVTEFLPEEQSVVTRDGARFTYDRLVVAAGIQIDWEKVKGLPAALGTNGVCSNYTFETAGGTWEALQNLREGDAVFTAPNTAVKCGGAPQKIMYLADDYLRRQGLRERCRVHFYSAGGAIFSVPKYRRTLEGIIAQRDLQMHFKHNLVEVRADAREAVFENLDTGELVTQPFQMLHVTPPMSAPDFIKHSPLAADTGWVEVDRLTLQHVRYPTVFGIGDASNLPTSKTGAAIRKQAPVLVANLLASLDERPLTAKYNGYTSCPIVTRYGRMMLAEFDYDGNPAETFPFDQSKERWSMWLLKKYGLPLIYWKGMLTGRL